MWNYSETEQSERRLYYKMATKNSPIFTAVSYIFHARVYLAYFNINQLIAERKSSKFLPGSRIQAHSLGILLFLWSFLCFLFSFFSCVLYSPIFILFVKFTTRTGWKETFARVVNEFHSLILNFKARISFLALCSTRHEGETSPRNRIILLKCGKTVSQPRYAVNWLRTITSIQQFVAFFLFWTRWYDITG